MYAVMNEEDTTQALIDDDRIPLLRISLKMKDGKITVEEVYRTSGYKPAGEIGLEDEVPASIIGHWVEITSLEGKVVYRRYVQKSLPFNMENADSKLQRIYSLEKYRILVPDLPEGHLLTLYEQSIPAPGYKLPERKTRLKLGLVYSRSNISNI